MNMSEQTFLSVPARHTHKNMQLVQGRTQITKAKEIQASLGTSVAAAYLRNRGWSVEAAVVILCHKGA